MTNTNNRYFNRSQPLMYGRRFCFALLALSTASGMTAAQQQNGDLTVLATGFASNQGHSIARLYYPGSDLTRKGTREVKAAIQNGQSTVVFAALPAGDYAIVVFHDADDNDTVDHNFIRLPVEALGFSNGFRVTLTSGMPNFEKLRFTHGGKAQTVQLSVK